MSKLFDFLWWVFQCFLYNKATDQKETDLEKIKSKIEKQKERKDTLLNAFLDWDIEKDIYKSKVKIIDDEMRELKKILYEVLKFLRNFIKY